MASRTPLGIIAVAADNSVRSRPCIIPTIIDWPRKSLDTPWLRSRDPYYRNTIKILPRLFRGDYDEGVIARRYLKYSSNEVKSKGISRSR